MRMVMDLRDHDINTIPEAIEATFEFLKQAPAANWHSVIISPSQNAKLMKDPSWTFAGHEKPPEDVYLQQLNGFPVEVE